MEDKLAKVLKSTPVTPVVTTTFEGHTFPLQVSYRIFEYEGSVVVVVYSPLHETKTQVLSNTWSKDYPMNSLYKEITYTILNMFNFGYVSKLVAL